MKIEVSSEIRTACPAFAGVAISAKVVNTAYNEELWQKINEFTRSVAKIPAAIVLQEKRYVAGYFADSHYIR